jgi:hypothetical protein
VKQLTLGERISKAVVTAIELAVEFAPHSLTYAGTGTLRYRR